MVVIGRRELDHRPCKLQTTLGGDETRRELGGVEIFIQGAGRLLVNLTLDAVSDYLNLLGTQAQELSDADIEA